MSYIDKRKMEHIEICLGFNVKSDKETLFGDVEFIHSSLPEISLEEIEVSTEFLKNKFKVPLIITGMTGGHPVAENINRELGEIAEEMGLGLGIGSQRPAIENRELRKTFEVVREAAPTAFIIANIGLSQLIEGYGEKEILEAVEMIEANALAIHLNPLQEAVQPEGNVNYRGGLKKIAEVCKYSPVPIIVKETGAGMSYETAEKLKDVGVKAIDISGAGGTSWGIVEHYRASWRGETLKKKIGKTFGGWGIPTAASILETKKTGLEIIASGGIRNGVEAAKAIALGADITGQALPILRKLILKGKKEVKIHIRAFINEFKTAMFLTGSKNINDLKGARVVLTGRLYQWAKQRKLI